MHTISQQYFNEQTDYLHNLWPNRIACCSSACFLLCFHIRLAWSIKTYTHSIDLFRYG
jgi:hypothetical protein